MAAAAESDVIGSVFKCCSTVSNAVMKVFNTVCGIFAKQIRKLPVPVVTVILRVLNISNAILMFTACIFAFKDLVVGCGACPTRTFLATYIGLFALVLLFFETRVKYTENFIRKNFGFMFTWTGRAVFLIFIGAICFGMIDSSKETKEKDGYAWVVGVGVGTLVNAIFNCFIICSHPGFQKANQHPSVADGPAGNNAAAGGDPSKMTEAQIKAYLEAHPEIAAAAVASVSAKAAQPVNNNDWTGASAPQQPASGTGNKIGGFFGGNKKNNQAQQQQAAYVPPSFTGSVEPSTASVPVAKAVNAPKANNNNNNARNSNAAPQRQQQPAATLPSAIDDESNPFASSNNPFAV